MQVHFAHQGTFSLPASALTIGNFDGVHLGHQAMLAHLRERAARSNLPTVLLTFEPLPRQYFAPQDPPARLTPLRDKLRRLEQVGLLDHVLLFRFNQSFANHSAADFVEQVLIQQLQAKYVLIGDDFRFGAKRAGDKRLLAQYDAFETESMPTFAMGEQRVSSSAVRTVLAAGDLNQAKQLLGAPYSISGRVMHGKKLGRTIGFPTANVCLQHRKPALQGVFIVEADTPFGRLKGVASLGKNPTVSTNPDYKLEVFFFDFQGDLYGQRITVWFLKKLRDEEKYDSLPALIQQIEYDAAQGRAYFLTSKRDPA